MKIKYEKWRYLNTGERIRKTDIFYSLNEDEWFSFGKFYGIAWKALGYDSPISYGLRKHNGMTAVKRRMK